MTVLMTNTSDKEESTMNDLKNQINHIIIAAIFLHLAFPISATATEPLTVKMGPPIQYKSDDGKRFTARYGSLSDGSLYFVKVTMPNGKKYTLPQLISGSGVRYTDEREVVWWTHQGTVRIDVRNADGKWETQYSELKEVK